jgi:hypothetical protein
MLDPSTFFEHGRVPCRKCGNVNAFGSSKALYYADLSTPCTHCGFRFLEHMDRQMRKLMEMVGKDSEWRKLLRSGRHDLVKQRLDELVPLPEDR